MTFDLEWANDPTSGGITGSRLANVIWAVQDGSVVTEVAVQHDGPGYYHANNALWWLLMDAMDEAGLLDSSPRSHSEGLPLVKLEDNSGAHVTPDEVRTALESYRRRRWDALDYFKDEPDPAWCASTWDKWINWLTTAADHGGFRVY